MKNRLINKNNNILKKKKKKKKQENKTKTKKQEKTLSFTGYSKSRFAAQAY